MIWLNAAAVIGGLALLAFSADRFILGATTIATRLGVPSLIVGLTVVGIGTSLPEIVVAVIASLQHKAPLAIGNAIGSNITNIALVVGSAALLSPLMVSARLARRDLPILLGVSLLAWLLALDGYYTRFDGVILLAGLLLVLVRMARDGLQATRQGRLDSVAAEGQAVGKIMVSTVVASFWLVVGALLMPLSSQALVWGASNIAAELGVSELVVGLTIVAIGTSLPELATSLAAVRRGEHDLVLGNVVGSNLFNLLAVLSIPALLAPGALPAGLLTRDLPIMLALTLVLSLLCWRPGGRDARIGRMVGLLLLCVFVAYEALLYRAASF